MFLIRCYKHPVFNQMLLSIQGMIRFDTGLVSGGCVSKSNGFPEVAPYGQGQEPLKDPGHFVNAMHTLIKFWWYDKVITVWEITWMSIIIVYWMKWTMAWYFFRSVQGFEKISCISGNVTFMYGKVFPLDQVWSSCLDCSVFKVCIAGQYHTLLIVRELYKYT